MTKRDTEQIQFVYNSNLESETDFYACEVDKYLQKNFPVYRGVVEVMNVGNTCSTKLVSFVAVQIFLQFIA